MGATGQTLKTGTTMGALGYVLVNVGAYLQGDIGLHVLLSAVALGLTAFFGRRAVTKIENGSGGKKKS